MKVWKKASVRALVSIIRPSTSICRPGSKVWHSWPGSMERYCISSCMDCVFSKVQTCNTIHICSKYWLVIPTHCCVGVFYFIVHFLLKVWKNSNPSKGYDPGGFYVKFLLQLTLTSRLLLWCLSKAIHILWWFMIYSFAAQTPNKNTSPSLSTYKKPHFVQTVTNSS